MISDRVRVRLNVRDENYDGKIKRERERERDTNVWNMYTVIAVVFSSNATNAVRQYLESRAHNDA